MHLFILDNNTGFPLQIATLTFVLLQILTAQFRSNEGIAEETLFLLEVLVVLIRKLFLKNEDARTLFWCSPGAKFVLHIKCVISM